MSHPSVLKKHYCLDHENNMYCSWRYLVEGNEEKFFIHSKITTQSSMDLLQMAISGLGVVYLPDFVVLSAIKAGKLVEVMPAFRPKPMGIYAVYPGLRYREKKVDVFVHFLESVLAI